MVRGNYYLVQPSHSRGNYYLVQPSQSRGNYYLVQPSQSRGNYYLVQPSQFRGNYYLVQVNCITHCNLVFKNQNLVTTGGFMQCNTMHWIKRGGARGGFFVASRAMSVPIYVYIYIHGQ